ncbi:MAG: hypothetical protein AAGJ17_05755, partial [Pseudomonadota bacterium]
LTSLKISYLEQLNSKISASLSTSFSCLKIDRLIKRIGIRSVSDVIDKLFLLKNKTLNYEGEDY